MTETQIVPSDLLEEVLSSAMESGGSFAEIFVEDRRSTSAVLDDGLVEELNNGRDRGAGIRVVSGETTGFAHTADLSAAGLHKAAKAASSAARSNSESVVEVDLGNERIPKISEIEIFPKDVSKSKKVALLKSADESVREAGLPVTQVAARYGDSHRIVQIANSEGLLTGDRQIRSSFSVSCVAAGDAGMQLSLIHI